MVLNVFKQQQDFSILEIINKEMRIYRYYQRLINRHLNYSQLRIIVYSLYQQLIRQDPQYYRLYYALRPNSQQQLILYPYYIKFAVKGDSIAFCHININIPSLLESGYSADIIQGSVSLDNKTKDNYMVILPSIYYYLELQQEDLKA